MNTPSSKADQLNLAARHFIIITTNVAWLRIAMRPLPQAARSHFNMKRSERDVEGFQYVIHWLRLQQTAAFRVSRERPAAIAPHGNPAAYTRLYWIVRAHCAHRLARQP